MSTIISFKQRLCRLILVRCSKAHGQSVLHVANSYFLDEHRSHLNKLLDRIMFFKFFVVMRHDNGNISL